MVKNKKISQKHIHIQEIPKKYFPRTGKSKEYARDVIKTAADLDFINRKIQYSAQLCIFNITSVTQKSGFTPKEEDVFREIKEFVYHYENYCYRLYTFREKLIQFINAFMPIGYTDKEVRIRDVIVSPLIKNAGMLPLIEMFNKNTALSKLLNDRTKMTHRLYYYEDFDRYLRPKNSPKGKNEEEVKKWFNDWKKQIASRSSLVNKSRESLDIINHLLAEKLVQFKSKK